MRFWRKEFSDEEIQFALNKIREFRSLSSEGNVSLSGAGNVDAWTAFLVSAVGLDIRTDALRTSIIRGVLFSPDLNEDFSEKDFKKVTYKLKNLYQNIETKAYRVVFPIWNKPSFLHGVKKGGDVSINFSPSTQTQVYKRIVRERFEQQSSKSFLYFFNDERLHDISRCSLCIAYVKANTPADANERASEAVYEQLGLVNLAKDGGKYWRSSTRVNGKYPVSEVLIGPHTTTHFDDGILTHAGFWHENWVGGPSQTQWNSDAMQSWETRYAQLARGVAQSAWRQDCKLAAARYFKAFSNPNLEESFLDGWRLFESVTGTQYEKTDERIDRASNVFENYIGKRIIGKHLARRRNLIAHGHSIKADDEEVLAFQMLQFIAPYMECFILNAFSFKSPRDFWDFLNLPNSKEKRNKEQDDLNRRMSLLEKAALFREEKP